MSQGIWKRLVLHERDYTRSGRQGGMTSHVAKSLRGAAVSHMTLYPLPCVWHHAPFLEEAQPMFLNAWVPGTVASPWRMWLLKSAQQSCMVAAMSPSNSWGNRSLELWSNCQPHAGGKKWGQDRKLNPFGSRAQSSPHVLWALGCQGLWLLLNNRPQGEPRPSWDNSQAVQAAPGLAFRELEAHGPVMPATLNVAFC